MSKIHVEIPQKHIQDKSPSTSKRSPMIAQKKASKPSNVPRTKIELVKIVTPRLSIVNRINATNNINPNKASKSLAWYNDERS